MGTLFLDELTPELQKRGWHMEQGAAWFFMN